MVNQFVSIMEIQFVLCAVETETSNIIYRNFMFDIHKKHKF
jgi:hypothetical protein